MGLAILQSKWDELSSDSSEPSQTKSRVSSPEPISDLTPSWSRAKLRAEPSGASSWFHSPDTEPQAEPEPRTEMSRTTTNQPSWAEPSQAESRWPESRPAMSGSSQVKPSHGVSSRKTSLEPSNDLEPNRSWLWIRPILVPSLGLVKAVQAALTESWWIKLGLVRRPC